jgi:translation elongation factor EF-Tu-like GTPase
MKPLTPSFIAELTYYTAKQGGRKTPAFSGYRPHVKFPFSTFLTSGQQKFIGTNKVYPGDNVTAEITILAVDSFQKTLYNGLRYSFGEGPITVGEGVIIEVLNNILLKSTN